MGGGGFCAMLVGLRLRASVGGRLRRGRAIGWGHNADREENGGGDDPLSLHDNCAGSY
jgi:hypothetical protein